MAELPDALHVLAILLALVAAGAGARGLKLFVRGLRCGNEALAPLWIVRGIRGIVVGVAAAAVASGLLLAQTWLLVFGAVFLAEELYETAVLALVLRAGLRSPSWVHPGADSNAGRRVDNIGAGVVTSRHLTQRPGPQAGGL